MERCLQRFKIVQLWRAELKRLREENRQLRMEKEILKKAAAFFAKESTEVSVHSPESRALAD